MTGPWEGAFNQQGNKLTIDGDFRTSGLFWFQGYLHIIQVTGIPGPVTRILTSIKGYYNTSLLVIAVICLLVTNSLVTVHLSPVWVLAQFCIITLAFSLRVTIPNIYLALAQCPLTLTNQDLYTPESQPPVVLNIGLPPGLFLGSS